MTSNIQLGGSRRYQVQVPNEITYAEVVRVIEHALANSNHDYIALRVQKQTERCPLVAHFYRVWMELQTRVKRAHTSDQNRELMKHFTALQRVEGALAMLLTVLEMNPETTTETTTETSGAEPTG